LAVRAESGLRGRTAAAVLADILAATPIDADAPEQP